MNKRLGSASPRASVSSLALAAGWLLAAHPAAAQATAPAQPAGAAAADNGNPIVMVTAERRTVNLQRAPVAAAVVSGAQLAQRAIYTVDQLQFISPSFTVSNFGDGEDFNIRGIGKGETNIQTPSGIVVYRDGVAVFPGFFTEEPYFIANIEILRGPQGTFAGQNADGGAIFITENDPNFRGDHGSIEAQYGNYNDVRLRGVLNMPLSDTFAMRLAVNTEREDSPFKLHGPFTGDPGRIQEFNGRVGLLWQPTSALRVEFKNDFNYLDAGGIVGSPIPTPATGPYPTYASASGLFNVGNNVHNLASSWWDRSVLSIAYTFPDGIVLKSISGYQDGRGATDYSLDGTATLPADYFTVIGEENIWSEEVNLISPDSGRIRWVAGAYFQDDTVHIPGTRAGFDISSVPTNGLDILLDYTTPKTTEAAFGQVSYDITDALQIVAGARYTHSEFTLTDKTSVFLTIPGLFTFLPLGSESAHRVQNDDAVTGKIDLNWKLDANNFLYAFVANGHKPGGINTTPLPFVPGSTGVVPFQPENLTTYEAGWKPTFFDGHLRAQIDGFYTTYQGFQLSYATSVIGGGGAPGQSIIRNVPGSTTIYGVEGQAQGVFGDWAFDVTGDYLHTQLGSSRVAEGGPTLPGFALGLPENVSGNQQPYAPQWSFSVGAQYTFHLANDQTLTPHVDYSYTSDQWASPFQGNDPTLPAGYGALEKYLFHLRPTNLVNAQLTWDNGPVHIALYGTNIFNEQYFYESGTPGLRIAGAPTQFGIRASRTF
jgi:iron complex outermembrane receptor protein